MIWENDKTAYPTIPSPDGYGWKKDDESEWQPVMSTLPPAPDVVLHLVKCGCQKTRCATKHCACAKASLPCTDMCRCMDTDELCANTAAHQESDASAEDEEGENDECEDDEDIEDTYFD